MQTNLTLGLILLMICQGTCQVLRLDHMMLERQRRICANILGKLSLVEFEVAF